MRMGVRIADIPESLLANIDSNLQHYFLPILGRDDERPTEPLRLIGSGTFVSIHSCFHILTAAHVWDATKTFPVVGLLLGSGRSCLSIPRTHIEARELWGRHSEETGPDLALLAIPPHLVAEVRAYKSAVDLVQQRNKFLADQPHSDSGLWAVIGVVGESSSVRPHLESRAIEVKCYAPSFVGGIDATFERDGYDYLDAGADTSLPAVPQSFGGVSGGALWQIVLAMNGTGQLSWNGQKYFHGVAFSEWETQPGRLVIRCHGRKSLFEKAWKEWGLPN